MRKRERYLSRISYKTDRCRAKGCDGIVRNGLIKITQPDRLTTVILVGFQVQPDIVVPGSGSDPVRKTQANIGRRIKIKDNRRIKTVIQLEAAIYRVIRVRA